MKNLYRSILVIILLTSVVVTPANVFSCGPYFPTAIFVKSDGPDFAEAEYLHGRLGIVGPDFDKFDLFIAYRYLTGRPFSATELGVLSDTSAVKRIWELPSPAEAGWRAAREQIPGVTTLGEIPSYTQVPGEGPSSYQFYVNINDDAFVQAQATLTTRVGQFGANSPFVLDWVRAQDAVFMSAKSNAVPPPADSAAPPVFRADRTYQIASARFYMRDFGEAKSLFASIGMDTASPWMRLSRYLVARSTIREATLLSPNRDSLLVLAEVYLQSMLADRQMEPMYGAITRLLRYCRIRTHPKELFAELDRRITGSPLGVSFVSDWDDYIAVLPYPWEDSSSYYSEFADWVSTYRIMYPEKAFSHSYAKWEETHSVAWLVAALSKAIPGAPGLTRLLDAAEAIPLRAPEKVTADYWRVRILIASGEIDKARALSDSLFAEEAVTGSRSNTNRLLAERARIAHNLEEYIGTCHQRPYSVSWELDAGNGDRWTSRSEVFAPPATVLNKCTPLSVLHKLCGGSLLPANLRASLVRSTWARACLVGEERIAKELAPVLAEVNPEMRSQIAGFLSTRDNADRRFAAAFLMLKFPGLRPSIRMGMDRPDSMAAINDFRDNWWYSGDLAVESHQWQSYHWSFSGDDMRRQDSVAVPLFLTHVERGAAELETAKLRALPAAATYLGSIVTSFAKVHPEDPRVPEALHLSIRVSRYGCTDAQSRTLSRLAFTMLHKRYPASQWADKTKYWF